MDERKATVRELEERKRADIEAGNRLLEGFGEILLQRIGDGEPEGPLFDDKSGETPGAVLALYRKLQADIAESGELIARSEADAQRLKELEAVISAREGENSGLERELTAAETRLGKALLTAPEADDFAGPLKQREELLLAKIAEQEAKLEDLEEREGGVLSWLGKNAQMAVARTILLKDRGALERLYRATGEKFLSNDGQTELPGGEMAGILEKAGALKREQASLAEELSGLKAERRKILELFNAEGSPPRRIHGLEKHIAGVRREFPGVYLRLGSLAAEESGKEAFSAFFREEDGPVFEKTSSLKARIAQTEREIEKIRASISIDNEKAEIEKMEKAIAAQHEKISAAEKAVGDLERQIAESEQRIEELNAFISNIE